MEIIANVGDVFVEKVFTVTEPRRKMGYGSSGHENENEIISHFEARGLEWYVMERYDMWSVNLGCYRFLCLLSLFLPSNFPSI